MIQYPKNTHLTLPSVEGGFGTTNILRDPPKSIHTRFKPKVGETSKITEWIDSPETGNRICEGINVYARGVNPMVSVSYSNYGTNGGQVRYRGGARGTDQAPISTIGQAYLPYRVNRDGAFRPPIKPPQELLPLSRLPRVTTSQTSNPGSEITNINPLMKCKTDLREIRKQLLQVSASPKAIFNIETPHTTPNEVKHMINNNNNYNITTNVSSNKTYQLGINPTPDRGIKQYTNYAAVPSKPYKNLQIIGLDGYAGNQPMPIQEIRPTACTTNVSGPGGKENYVHDSRTLERNRPITSAMANPSQRGVDINSTISSRNCKLPERRSRGAFENSGFKHSTYRNQPDVQLSNDSSVYQMAAKQLESRGFGKTFNEAYHVVDIKN